MSNKTGRDRIIDARLNKGSAFKESERKEYHLEGLLPKGVETERLQLRRELRNLRSKTSTIEQYVFLMELLNRNERLFYKLIVENIKECMPLVYTPTVGKACQLYSHIWSQPRGIYISIQDKGNVERLLRNWSTTDIKAIVFTDGERILGLGDLGINGMGIPVGKLQLYSACAGIPPSQCLPVCIDNGTNTGDLIKDEFYMGLKQPRVRGQEFDDLIIEFMDAAKKVFGKSVLLQFEDFGNSTAFGLLDKTRDNYTTFNDDIQGTACVALGGIMAALKADDTPNTLAEHTVLFLGAGEAGTGIGSLIAYAIAKEDGVPIEEARRKIWFVDRKGLITATRAQNEDLVHHKAPWAHDTSDLGGDVFDNFLAAVKAVKPTMIVGVSAMPGMFTEEVVKTMCELNKRPIIFALSNPTDKCECTAQDAYDWSNGKCIFASGSPFGTINSCGKVFEPGQGNNAYVFPGIALGVIAAEATVIPEDLFYTAACCLAAQVSPTDYARGSLYPRLEDIQRVSFKIAMEVAAECFDLGIALAKKPADLAELIKSKQEDFGVEGSFDNQMYTNVLKSLDIDYSNEININGEGATLPPARAALESWQALPKGKVNDMRGMFTMSNKKAK